MRRPSKLVAGVLAAAALGGASSATAAARTSLELTEVGGPVLSSPQQFTEVSYTARVGSGACSYVGHGTLGQNGEPTDSIGVGSIRESACGGGMSSGPTAFGVALSSSATVAVTGGLVFAEDGPCVYEARRLTGVFAYARPIEPTVGATANLRKPDSAHGCPERAPVLIEKLFFWTGRGAPKTIMGELPTVVHLAGKRLEVASEAGHPISDTEELSGSWIAAIERPGETPATCQIEGAGVLGANDTKVDPVSFVKQKSPFVSEPDEQCEGGMTHGPSAFTLELEASGQSTMQNGGRLVFEESGPCVYEAAKLVGPLSNSAPPSLVLIPYGEAEAKLDKAQSLTQGCMGTAEVEIVFAPLRLEQTVLYEAGEYVIGTVLG